MFYTCARLVWALCSEEGHNCRKSLMLASLARTQVLMTIHGYIISRNTAAERLPVTCLLQTCIPGKILKPC